MLGYLGLNGRGSPAPFVKAYVKPPVNVAVELVVPVAEFPGTYAFFRGPGFRGGAVFVGTADIEGFVAPEAAEPGKDVGGKHLYQVPQVGYVVYIGKRGADKSSFHGTLFPVQLKYAAQKPLKAHRYYTLWS
jgi:hypothetical protein